MTEHKPYIRLYKVQKWTKNQPKMIVVSTIVTFGQVPIGRGPKGAFKGARNILWLDPDSKYSGVNTCENSLSCAFKICTRYCYASVNSTK